MSPEQIAHTSEPTTTYNFKERRFKVAVKPERQPYLPGFEPDFIPETHTWEEYAHNLKLVGGLPDNAPYFYFFHYEKLDPQYYQLELPEYHECECGNSPTEWFSCTQCGSFKWCDDCKDDTLIWNHADHDCDRDECCKSGHRAQVISFYELLNTVPKVSVSRTEVELTDTKRVWHVAARRCTQEEILSTVRLWAANYYIVEDWPEDVEKDPYSDLSW